MKILKKIKETFFYFIYGKIEKINYSEKIREKVLIKKVFFSKNLIYDLLIIKKARLFTSSVHDTAVIVDNKILKEGSFQYRHNKFNRIINGKVSQNLVLKRGTPAFVKTINQNLFSILRGGAAKNNYFHWLFDVLPCFEILKKSKKKFRNLNYLVPSLKFAYQKETLKLLGLHENQIINGEKYSHLLIKKNLIISNHPYVFNNNPTKSIQNIPIWIINWLRKTFLNKAKYKNFNYERIYINREDSKLGNIRRIVNNDEVVSNLKMQNFKILNLSEYSFIHQVNLFKNAKIIIGLHGAGFANLVFSRQGTKIIELKSVTAGNLFKNLAKSCKLKYFCISAKSKNKSLKYQNGLISINIKKLNKLINA